MRHAVLRAAGLACLIPLALPAPAAAQDVLLTSRDGAIRLEGTLTAWDGEFYRVETTYGPLTLAAEGVLCDGPGCPDLTVGPAAIALEGTALIGAGLLPELIADYAAAHGLALRRPAGRDGTRDLHLSDSASGAPVARLALTLSSSDAGLLALMSGQADVALSLAELSDPAVHARLLARDAFLPVVAPDNPLPRLTLPVLADILAGEVTSWAALGGMDVPIALHLPGGSEAGIGQALEAALLAPSGRAVTSRARRHGDPAALTAAVAADPFALGVTLASQGIGPARQPELADACGRAFPASAVAVQAGDYPLTLPLIVHVRAGRQPLQLRRLLGHLDSPTARAAIRRAGFVDPGPQAVALEAQGRRLANAVLAADPALGLEGLQRLFRAMDGAERLSTTLRFEPGTSRLDLAARSAVQRLARDLEAGMHDGRTIVFAGFSDAQGPTEVNLRLSRERAEAVRDAVRDAAPLLPPGRVRMQVEGFASALPMACDDSDWGRALNRRVEVWLR